MASAATTALKNADVLLLTDVVLAECVYVLESFYGAARDEIAHAMRGAIAFPAVRTLDPDTVLRSLEIYEREGVDYTDAYLIAQAEASGVGKILSFDRDFDRLPSITRIDPS